MRHWDRTGGIQIPPALKLQYFLLPEEQNYKVHDIFQENHIKSGRKETDI